MYAHQVETLKTGLASAVQRTKKLEKKYKVLTTGYTNRQKELAKAISELPTTKHAAPNFGYLLVFIVVSRVLSKLA